MALEVIRTAPQLDAFTPLAEHQAQTPGSFFGGKPVLYYHCTNAELSLDSQSLSTSPAFAALVSSVHSDPNTDTPTDGTNGNSLAKHHMAGLDVWVTSDHFILFSPAASAGVQILYPTISLHAQQASALYMQLCLSDMSQTADDDIETLELLVTPAPIQTTDAVTNESDDGRARTQHSSAQALYAAVSACADLHPDPDESDDGEGGFGGDEEQTMPGAGGWITSENMHEFVDENGEFRMPAADGVAGTSLGAGAGTVRTADQFGDADEDADDHGNGDGDESKWRRTG